MTLFSSEKRVRWGNILCCLSANSCSVMSIQNYKQRRSGPFLRCNVVLFNFDEPCGSVVTRDTLKIIIGYCLIVLII